MEYYGPQSIFLLQFGTKINIFEDTEQTCVGPNKIAPIATCRPQLYVHIKKIMLYYTYYNVFIICLLLLSMHYKMHSR